MHRRLTAIYMALVAVAALGLAIPLCLVIVDRASTDLLLDRTSDASRFASLAEHAVVTGQTESLEAQLQVYSELFGIETVAVDTDGDEVAASRPGLTLTELQQRSGQPLEDSTETVMNALTGQRLGLEERIWPWTTHRLIVAEPITDGGETIGAVVSSSPTTAVARSTLLLWTLVALSVAALIGVGVAAARPVRHWVLRPVIELAQAVQAIGRGDLSTRVAERNGPAELKQLAGAFNEMSGTISRMMEQQSQFVAYAAHQIRNPLTVVRLRVEALGQQLPQEHRAAHQIALEELDRLTRTCHGLLSLARAGESELERVTVNIPSAAAQRVDAWQPIAQRQHAVLTADFSGPVWVRALEHTVEQALDVLIDNALKFGGEGVTVQISAVSTQSAMEDQECVEIIVADNGPGLPQSLLDEAAVPFWRRGSAPAGGDDDGELAGATAAPDEQASARSSAGGSGLGLSAVLALLELDSGTLQLQPVTPHGVRAVITLPAVDPPHDAPPSLGGNIPQPPDAAEPDAY